VFRGPSRRRLRGLWQSTRARAPVENPHLHDLRAEAGSQLLEAGVPLHDVRDALGHSSTTMTNAYLRTRVDILTRAYRVGPRIRHGVVSSASLD
jgi:integrase